MSHTENNVKIGKYRKTSQRDAQAALSLKKIPHVWLSHAKTTFIAMACDAKLHAMILWCVISMNLNIANKIAGLEK